MPLKDETLQLQLTRAQSQLSAVEKNLEGIEGRRSPQWRHANARVKQIESRLNACKTLKSPSTSGAGEEEADSEE